MPGNGIIHWLQKVVSVCLLSTQKGLLHGVAKLDRAYMKYPGYMPTPHSEQAALKTAYNFFIGRFISSIPER